MKMADISRTVSVIVILIDGIFRRRKTNLIYSSTKTFGHEGIYATFDGGVAADFRLYFFVAKF